LLVNFSAHARNKRIGGFTAIELMIVVTILAIVAAIAAPSFRTMIGTMNTKSIAFDLVSDLTMARSEAIKRNRNVTVVPVSGDWIKGWRVADDADTTLTTRQAITFPITIAAPEAGVTFLPNGRLSDELANNKTWLINSSVSGVTARCIVITPTGAARSKYGGC
jgi:type IV fimbrial biogenesis protein FimT